MHNLSAHAKSIYVTIELHIVLEWGIFPYLTPVELNWPNIVMTHFMRPEE